MAGVENTNNPDIPSPENSEQTDSHSSYIMVDDTCNSKDNKDIKSDQSSTEGLVEKESAEQEKESAEQEKDIDQNKTYCSFFQKGKCRFGESCFNLHETDPSYKPPKQQKNKNRKQKKESTSDDEEGGCAKCKKQKRKLRTVMDVVHRVQWDDQYDPKDFIVGFLDRFDGLVEEEFQHFDWSDVTTVDDWESFCIPKHRVYYFKQKGEIVWDRRTRLDNIFSEKEFKCEQCEKT